MNGLETVGEYESYEDKGDFEFFDINSELEAAQKWKNFENYYEAFLNFLNFVGSYQLTRKTIINAADGVYPVQKVAWKYYDNDYARMDYVEYDKNRRRWWKLEELNKLAQKVGFSPMDETEKREFMDFVEDKDRRRYIRDNAAKAQKRGILFSMNDLMYKRLELESRREEAKAKKNMH